MASNTERSKKWRKKIWSDPSRHEEYKKKDRERKKKKYAEKTGTVVIVFHIELMNSQSVFFWSLIILKYFYLCQLILTRLHICATNAWFWIFITVLFMTQYKYCAKCQKTSVISKQMWNCCINIKMWMLLLALNLLLMIFWKENTYWINFPSATSPPQQQSYLIEKTVTIWVSSCDLFN